MLDERAALYSNEADLRMLFVGSAESAQNTEAFHQFFRDFEELMMMYRCAIREVKTKLEVLNDEFQVRWSNNPIESIKYRVKKPMSIYEKLRRRGFPVSLDSIRENLHDVAGVRVVCGYVQDIYLIADLLIKQSDISLVEVKDYIKNPKPNGYRSLHLVVEVPVFFSDECRMMKAEVQIRTIAMDFWATLEHQIKYKNNGEVPAGFGEELKACADVISTTDMRMQKLYNELYPPQDEQNPQPV